MKLINSIIICYLIFIPFLQSQDIKKPISKNPQTESETGWKFGANMGFYFASPYTANYYNGSDKNENKISYIISNKYWRDDINRELNINDTFLLRELPQRMKYNTSALVGFLATYQVDKSNSFFIQFNLTKLEAKDFFTIEVDPATFLTFPDIRLFQIYGSEKRYNIDIGVQRLYPIKNKHSAFVEAGINLNNTKVIESKIRIENLEYSLVNVYLNQNYIPGGNLTEYVINQGGIGYGAFVGGGAKLVFSPTLTLDPGVSMHWSKIKLEGYERFRPHFTIFLRMVFTLSSAQDH